MLRNNSKQSEESTKWIFKKRKEGLQWEGFAEKGGLSLEWKSEWVMGYQIIVSMTSWQKKTRALVMSLSCYGALEIVGLLLLLLLLLL